MKLPEILFGILVLLLTQGIVAGQGRSPANQNGHEVDLRPRYFELGLHSKDQGRRPSCAVFALLGALEFHYSLETQSAVSLSEEFLIWATRQINPAQNNFDGFTFAEVLAALERFGVARSEGMPNSLGLPLDQLNPDPQTRNEALSRRETIVQPFSGSPQNKIEAIIRELDQGYPVAAAMAWPPQGVVARVHSLRDQQPREGAGHAVTIVGYTRLRSHPDEVWFLFRNSYGIHWGMGGYGLVSEVYLREHLWDVVGFRLPGK